MAKASSKPERTARLLDNYRSLILAMAFILIGFSTFAQINRGVRPKIQAKGYDYKEIAVDSLLRLPQDTFHLPVKDSGSQAYKGGKVWLWTGYLWSQSSGSGGGTGEIIKANLGIVKRADSLLATYPFIGTAATLRTIYLPNTATIYRASINGVYRDYRYFAGDTTPDDSVMVFTVPGGKMKMEYDYVDPIWFGAIPNDGLWDTAAVRKACDFARLSSKVKKVYFGTIGEYQIANIVLATKNGTEYDQFALTIEGAMTSLGLGVTLYNPNINGATFLLQTAKGVMFSNLRFKGVGPDFQASGNYRTAEDAQWTAATTGGTIRTNRKSPGQTAIAVDPFYAIGAFNSTIASSADYYPGLSAWYTNTVYSGSTNIIINNCTTDLMYVGLAEGLSGQANGEGIRVNGGFMNSVAYPFAYGQLQSRENIIDGLYVTFCHTYLSNSIWGTGLGDVPVSRNCNVNYAKYVFETNGNFTSPRFEGGYFEGVWSLGKHTGNTPIIIKDVDIAIAANNVLGIVSPLAPVLAESDGPLIIEGRNFTAGNYYSGIPFNCQQVKASGVRFEGGMPFQTDINRYDKITFVNSVWQQGGGNPIAIHDQSFNQSLDDANDALTNGTYLLPGSKYKTLDQRTYEAVGNKFDRIPLGTHAVTINAGAGTLTFPISSPGLLQAGDVITTQTAVNFSGDVYSATGTTLGYVTGISGTTITLSSISAGVANGSYDMYVARIPKFIPHTLGTLVATTSSITNVMVDGPFGTTFHTGDRIKAPGYLTEGTYVTGVSGTTISLSTNALASGTLVELYDAQVKVTADNKPFDYSGLTIHENVSNVWFKGDEIVNLNGSDTSYQRMFCIKAGRYTTASPPWFTKGGTGTSGTPLPSQTGNNGKVLTTNGSTATWEDPGTPCTWPAESALGTIYSKSSWTTSADFTTHGAITAAVSGGFINLANGNTSYNDYVTIGGPTNLNKWHMHSLVKVLSVAAASGIGVGLRWVNSLYKLDFIGSIALPNSGVGNVYAALIGSGTPTVYQASTDQLAFSLNDIIEVDIDFNINVATVTVKNNTTGAAAITVGKIWATPSAGSGMPNTGNFAIYSYGGSQQIRALDITSSTVKNASILVVGDSKTQGFYADNWSTTFPNLLSATYPVTTFRAGEADGVQQTLLGISELISLNPRQVVMNIGSNDLRAGRTFSQVTSDYSSVVTQLQAAGILVYHIVLPEDSTGGASAIGMTSFRNWVLATYGTNYIAQVWDTMQTSNKLKVAFQYDPVHPNQAGNAAIAAAIVSSGKLSICPSRTGDVVSLGGAGYIAKFNTASAIENSGLYNISGKIGLNTITPTSLFDVVGNTPTFNTAQFGTLGLQSVGNASVLMSNNSYFNSSTNRYRTNNPVSIFQMYNSDATFYSAPTGTKDSLVTLTKLFKIGPNITSQDAPITFGQNTTSGIPVLGMSYITGATDEKNWDEYVYQKQKHYRIVNDTPVTLAKDWMTVYRTGITIDSVTHPNSLLRLGIVPATSDSTNKAVSSAWVKMVVAGLTGGGGGGAGTVTDFSAGNFSPLFNTSEATTTTTPALTFTAINQNANLVFSGPSSGSAAAPTFRSLVAADIPTLDSSKVTGVHTENYYNTKYALIGSGSGGSLPSQTGHAGEFLTTNGTSASWATDSASIPIDVTLRYTSNVLGVAPEAYSVLYKSITITTSTYTVADGIATVFCNYTGGTLTVTLPAASTNLDRRITVQARGPNNVSVTPVATGFQNTLVQYNAVQYQSNGTDWSISK